MSHIKLNTTVATSEAFQLVLDSLSASLVPMLHGSPGIGKSDLLHAVAEHLNLKVIDIRLGQCDPTDMNGFPAKSACGKYSTYLPMDTFPLEDEPLPAGKDGWLILFDELPGAMKAVQDAAYKIILDRMVGQHHLHEKVHMVAAGNLATDGAIVNKMSTALQSRMVHLVLEPRKDNWIDWAIKSGIDHRVISFIEFADECFYDFDPKHTDLTYSCPRTLEMLSKLVAPWATIPREKSPLIQGTIGQGAGTKFVGYCEVFASLPTLAEILKDPMGAKLSKDPATAWATTGLIHPNIDSKNASTLMKYVNRMSIEFQISTLKNAIRRDSSIMALPEIQTWLQLNAAALA